MTKDFRRSTLPEAESVADIEKGFPKMRAFPTSRDVLNPERHPMTRKLCLLLEIHIGLSDPMGRLVRILL